MGLFSRKKELETLDISGLTDLSYEIGEGDGAGHASPGAATYDLLTDSRLPERARERAAKVVLKEVYHELRNDAVNERIDLEHRHEAELEELRERQRREMQDADSSIERMRERFKMTPA